MNADLLQSTMLSVPQKAKQIGKFSEAFKNTLDGYRKGLEAIPRAKLGVTDISTKVSYYFDWSGLAIENYANAQSDQIKAFLKEYFPSLASMEGAIDEALTLVFVQSKLAENKELDEADKLNLILWCKQKLCLLIALSAVRYGWHIEDVLLTYREKDVIYQLNHGENEDPKRLESNLKAILSCTKDWDGCHRDALLSFFSKIGLSFKEENDALFFDKKNEVLNEEGLSKEKIKSEQALFVNKVQILLQDKMIFLTPDDIENLFVKDVIDLIQISEDEPWSRDRIVNLIEKFSYGLYYYNDRPLVLPLNK